MKILFTVAHPDDESFFGGGTIAKLTEQGHEVVLISATRGEMGELGKPAVTTREEIASVRENEQRSAAKILGIQEVLYLDYIDGSLSSLKDSDFEEKLWPYFEQLQPDIVLTFNKEGNSKHPDHIVVSRVTTNLFARYMSGIQKHVRLYHSKRPQSDLKVLAAHKASYTAFGEIVGDPDESITTVVDISSTFEKKVQALHAHKTQHQDVEHFLQREPVIDLKKEYFSLMLENKII